jgi:predicted nucleic acid-binding Zn ribbon protein
MDPDEFLSHHRRMHEQQRYRRLLLRIYVVLTLLTLVAVAAIMWRPL